ncbi:hypothetical protein ABT160_44375 [Streptomyces sp. NPDC001941]|uniref:hypothetical protein n=1 Tax=Streptomyces sp. NPDC001941 TaxID=3154659 RepID=UPI0033346427
MNGTLVGGVRLGNDTSARQVTVFVTESGVLHRSHGLYGKLPRLSRPYSSPAVSRGTEPEDARLLARPIAKLREQHAQYKARGYTRNLISPVSVRLEVEEQRVEDRVLLRAFVGAAPAKPLTLDAAIKQFREALGLPSRPLSWAPRPQVLPARVEAALRVLADGSTISSPRHLPVGWVVSEQGVRLHVGRAGEILDRASVIELQAALSAWLRFTEPADGTG